MKLVSKHHPSSAYLKKVNLYLLGADSARTGKEMPFSAFTEYLGFQVYCEVANTWKKEVI